MLSICWLCRAAQLLSVVLRLKLKETEAADEPETVSYEKVLKISCNISNAVNYMQQGIMEACVSL